VTQLQESDANLIGLFKPNKLGDALIHSAIGTSSIQQVRLALTDQLLLF